MPYNCNLSSLQFIYVDRDRDTKPRFCFSLNSVFQPNSSLVQVFEDLVPPFSFRGSYKGSLKGPIWSNQAPNDKSWESKQTKKELLIKRRKKKVWPLLYCKRESSKHEKKPFDNFTKVVTVFKGTNVCKLKRLILAGLSIRNVTENCYKGINLLECTREPLIYKWTRTELIRIQENNQQIIKTENQNNKRFIWPL